VLLLLVGSLAGNRSLSCLRDQAVELHEAAMGIVCLLATVVRLDDDGVRVGRKVT